MENPVRSEAAAFRFLLLTIAAFALIVVAKVLVGTWAATAVFLAEAVGVTVWIMRQRGERPEPIAPVHRGDHDERRILVVANETVAGTALRDEIVRRARAAARARVFVVCPALNSRLRTWTSDEDAARAGAGERLERSLAALRDLGLEAEGDVGDQDPLQAMDDAFRTFGADEILIATHPEGRSHWLERGVVERAGERFTCPIGHVVVDLEAEAGRA